VTVSLESAMTNSTYDELNCESGSSIIESDGTKLAEAKLVAPAWPSLGSQRVRRVSNSSSMTNYVGPR